MDRGRSLSDYKLSSGYNVVCIGNSLDFKFAGNIITIGTAFGIK